MIRGNEIKQTVCRSLVMMATFAVAMPLSSDVFAAAPTFGEIATNFMSGQLEGIPTLISAVCYISGIIMIAQGVIKLKDHADNPNTKMAAGLVRLLAGAGLVAMPVVAKMVLETISLTGTTATPFSKINVTIGGS